MSGVRDPKDFPQTPGVKGIKALSQGLGDGPCLAPVEQDWEDVSPVEVHLGSCVNMLPNTKTRSLATAENEQPIIWHCLE